MYIPIHEELLDDRQPALVLTARGWTECQVQAVALVLERAYRNEEEYENTDNLRLARADNAEEVAAYEELRSCGCCGSFDERITVTELDKTTTEIMVGFNYGH